MKTRVPLIDGLLLQSVCLWATDPWIDLSIEAQPLSSPGQYRVEVRVASKSEDTVQTVRVHRTEGERKELKASDDPSLFFDEPRTAGTYEYEVILNETDREILKVTVPKDWIVAQSKTVPLRAGRIFLPSGTTTTWGKGWRTTAMELIANDSVLRSFPHPPS